MWFSDRVSKFYHFTDRVESCFVYTAGMGIRFTLTVQGEDGGVFTREQLREMDNVLRETAAELGEEPPSSNRPLEDTLDEVELVWAGSQADNQKL
ncbi:MAG: hypothetical protein ACYTEQ_12320 [Planctomycetota bacterium]|jgi:hypothetical protein